MMRVEGPDAVRDLQELVLAQGPLAQALRHGLDLALERSGEAESRTSRSVRAMLSIAPEM